MVPLPIDPFIEPIRASLASARAVVVTAQPGAGKTTRLPPSLLDAGPAILLQPRRVAARVVAARIASEREWVLGREVGYQVRFDRQFSPKTTRLLVVTEGILTSRLQTDPLLSDFATVIIDEFHERSVHADVAIALAKQAWRARRDLRIVVMSATIDPAPVSAFLDGCPAFEVPGRTFPLEVSYAPHATVERAVATLAARPKGDILCFLPGAGEIRRAIDAIRLQVGSSVEVFPLHGGLDPDEQARVLDGARADRIRVIVSTNIAETSVTVPGVTAVVDAGLQKVARYDAARGIDSLVTERVSQDAADQRAGRAGRLTAGTVVRLWDARDRLSAHRQADIHRIDLAAVLLDVLAWGGHPETFEWFERPRPEAVAAGLALLERLGALQNGAVTDLGRRLRRLPVHPRLARLVVEADGAWPAVQTCAVLSERHFLPPRTHSTTADVLIALDAWDAVPTGVKQAARDIDRALPDLFGERPPSRSLDERGLRRALLAAYPDRVGRRREPGSSRVKMSSGTGAVLGRESGVTGGDFLVALDVRAAAVETGVATPRGHAPAAGESIIRMAALLEPEWLKATARDRRHWLDETGRVRASQVDRYEAIVLNETPVRPDPAATLALLVEAWLARGPSEDDERTLRRLRFAGQAFDVRALVERAAAGRQALGEVTLSTTLDPALQRLLARDAPETMQVPSGRSVALAYTEDGGVMAAVKLQELFGWRETPRLGQRQLPVVLSLLAPSGRPVQVTRDLSSFWSRTYPEVRRELRGRYPKHPWPDDPWNARPTARTTSRRGPGQTIPPGKKTR